VRLHTLKPLLALLPDPPADHVQGVDRALVEFVAVPDGMGELRAAVDLLSDTLLSHLAWEERELVEPLARLGMR